MVRFSVGRAQRGGDGQEKSPRAVAAGSSRGAAYLDALRVDFFSPPWLLRLLEALAWLRDDLGSLLAELRSDLLRELLLELLDCFVAISNSLNALR
jgi:hypothetical protein